MKKTELLLPVGNMKMCMAAVHYGADAIYVGVPFFNARGRSADLTIDELKEMIDMCHLYGVKVNLAFNVIIFQNELPKIVDLIRQILPLNPDALIVQDIGLASIIRSISPFQRIHASTQMTITNAEAIRFLDDLGIDRFVLGRENSLDEIKLIREKTQKELEVFVHGALCVAYSGQCFTSESLGGRSANRGQCAQSCRLEYELYVDDVKKDLGDKKYLVSPKDLFGIEVIGDLKNIGVDSFKVEGRLKTAEYVASAAKNYRQVLDGAPINAKERSFELASTYSRGFFSGWFHGVNHQKLVDGTFSSHRGTFVGEILEVRSKTIIINSSFELKSGMGLVFISDDELGAKIFSVKKTGKNFEVELLGKKLNLKKGMRVFVNSNEPLSSELEKGWSTRDKQKRIELKFYVQAKLDQPLLIRAIDPDGHEVEVTSSSNLSKAKNQVLTDQFIKDELSALTGSIYLMKGCDFSLEENLFLPHKELKELRKSIVEKMNDQRLFRPSLMMGDFQIVPMDKTKAEMGLNILLRTKDQVQGFLNDPYFEENKKIIKTILLDFEFGKDYLEAVKLIQKHGFRAGIATTRILKPGEYYNLNSLIRIQPDVILVRNLGAAQYLKERCSIPLMGDFSLNVSNSVSLNYLIQKGLESVNLSYDLNQSQLMDLIEFSDPSRVEITLHQYMPEFHMEHCVFAAFLSSGSSFKDCGKPCEKHEIKLKDPYGNMHFLKADHECRNTFFKATPQSAGFLISKLKLMDVSTFRIEALNENSVELNSKIKTYIQLMKEEISLERATYGLKLQESYGLETGQLTKTDRYKDRKKVEF